VTVEVTVANNGDFFETFNVTAYGNQTLIELREVANLAPRTQQLITCNWDTTGLDYGNYTLRANATILDEETNTDNNVRDDGLVTIASSNKINFPISVGGITFYVLVNINSTVTELAFSSALKKISYEISGENGTLGVCFITIPIELLGGNYTVLFDGASVDPEYPNSNSTHTTLFFTYTHPIHVVGIEIIGETAATPPIATIAASETDPLVDELLTLDGSSSYDPDGNIVSRSWDFGDSSTASDEIVQHSYSTFGNYTVTLTVEDNEGYTNSTEIIIRAMDYPTASLAHTPTNPLVNETVVFDATSSQPKGGSITGYEWDFGDGQTGTGSAPTHAYAATGSFMVDLTVTDSEGLANSTAQIITVTIHNIAITNVAAS